MKESHDFSLEFPEKRPLVTVTLGGGGDGEILIDSLLSMLEQNLHQNAYNVLLLTGPFVPLNLLEKVKKMAEKLDDFRCTRFVKNTQVIFKESAAVVTMGGYNTLSELVALGKYPLVVPRVEPRVEQLIRAQVFHKKGFVNTFTLMNFPQRFWQYDLQKEFPPP